MTYTPRPGTYAYRAIVYLQTLSPGTSVPASQIALRLGCKVSDIVTALGPAVDAGLVLAQKKNAHPRAPTYWSMA